MINTIIEISSYIFIAILLGLIFGWLITSLLLKEKYQEDLTDVSEELDAYKKDYTLLKAKVEEFDLKENNTAPLNAVDASNGTLDECQKRLHGKDELIASLTTKLSLSEEKQMEIEKKYEEEIDAFMFERIDITQKYKALLEKCTVLKEDKEMLKEKTSWFSRLFSSPSSPVS
jgi:uncharacterized membrane-anchored protein YhcB (DUF1043 family)